MIILLACFTPITWMGVRILWKETHPRGERMKILNIITVLTIILAGAEFYWVSRGHLMSKDTQLAWVTIAALWMINSFIGRRGRK